MTEQSFDIAINGTGPAGYTAALLLSRLGYTIALVGPGPEQADARSTAVMMPGLEKLEPFSILESLAGIAAPLKVMRIVDGTKRMIRSPAVAFHASEIGESAFAYNIPNRDLNRVLSRATSKAPGITFIEGFSEDIETGPDHVRIRVGNRVLKARLLVGADGRNSPSREAAGIQSSNHAYPQRAIVCDFDHSKPHGFASTEFHTEHGPCTLVPMPGNRSSLVWVVSPPEAERLLALPDADFASQLETRISSVLGTVTAVTKRQSFPMTRMTVPTFAARRIALVGEAGHVFPPIGAQGFNLGLRDAADLADALKDRPDDPGSDAVLRRYDRMRRPDVMQRTGMVDALNRSLLSSALPAQFARAVGLQALASISPLRSLVMREGLAPGRGLRELVPARGPFSRQR